MLKVIEVANSKMWVITGGPNETMELEGDSIRMCLLCADGQGAVDMFPLRLPHQFNGGLLDYLVVAMATNGVDDTCQGENVHGTGTTVSVLRNEAIRQF